MNNMGKKDAYKEVRNVRDEMFNFEDSDKEAEIEFDKWLLKKVSE